MKIDVSGLGNPLVDILVYIDDDFLLENKLTKGIMHLIEKNKKEYLLDKIKDKKYEISIGGSCPNTIATLSMLGLKTALTGKIGQDRFGSIFEQKTIEINVISYLIKDKGDTGTSTILITPDKERTMNTYLGVCREYKKKDLPTEMVEKSSFFHFTGFMWDTENQKQATRYAIDIAKRSGVMVVFDVADPFAVNRNREDFLRLIKDDVDIVFANAQESRILTGVNIEKGIRKLGAICNIAVIKNGEKDTYISNYGNIISVPSFKCNVLDTTGAGDNFSAGFIYGLIKGYSLDMCGKIASFVAAKTVEKIGAKAPENLKDLLEDMLKICQ